MYQYFLAPLIGFLFGSLPFAWIIVKLSTGKDIREVGSGSVSTRNTIRTAGWGWAILTASLDVGKGFTAAFLIRFYLFTNFIGPFNYLVYETSILIALCGIGAYAGHCWMPWMKFKGGKGFAVLMGALIVINPWGILIFCGSLPIWLAITRYSSAGGILATASIATALSIFYLIRGTYWNDASGMIFGWGCTILVILRMIPDFKLIYKKEIKRWEGLKASQWMR